MALLSAKGLVFGYEGQAVLDGVALELEPGELVALVGPNGAGKTTLLHLLCGIHMPSAGEVRLGERLLGELHRREIARQVALVPQDIRSDFSFTVREVVAMGRTPHLGRFRPEGAEDVAAVERALEATETPHLGERPLTELSGGERQRVHIARALAQETEILLLDEPTASLDVEHQLQILGLLRERAVEGRAVMAAIHDLSLAARFCDRILVLSERRIAASGPPEAVVTAESLEKFFRIRGRVERDANGVVVVVAESPLSAPAKRKRRAG